MLATMTTLSNFKVSSITQQITPFKVPSSAETLLSGSSTCFLPRSSRGCFTVKPHCRAGNSCDQLHNLGYRRRVATAYAGHKTPCRFRGVKYIDKHKMAHAKSPSAATAVPLETAKIGELENDWDDENEPSGMHAGKYFNTSGGQKTNLLTIVFAALLLVYITCSDMKHLEGLQLPMLTSSYALSRRGMWVVYATVYRLDLVFKSWS
jgi:hypothetical protein